MQDRFKFRVWCKTKQEWEKDEICITNKEHYIITNPKFTRVTNIDPQYHEINFCTGLKDKSGKLIYEGDIIYKKGSKDYKKEKMYSRVCWDSMYAQFNISDKNGMHQMPSNSNNIEVIGNIYENSELLKDNE